MGVFEKSTTHLNEVIEFHGTDACSIKDSHAQLGKLGGEPVTKLSERTTQLVCVYRAASIHVKPESSM